MECCHEEVECCCVVVKCCHKVLEYCHKVLEYCHKVLEYCNEVSKCCHDTLKYLHLCFLCHVFPGCVTHSEHRSIDYNIKITRSQYLRGESECCFCGGRGQPCKNQSNVPNLCFPEKKIVFTSSNIWMTPTR